MSDEIRMSLMLSFAKDGMADTMATPGVPALDMSGSNWIHNRQAVGTSQEPLLLGDVATPGGGWLCIRNLGPTNFVSVKPSSSASALVQVLAGEFALFRLHSAVTLPQVQADTAAVTIEYLLLQA